MSKMVPTRQIKKITKYPATVKFSGAISDMCVGSQIGKFSSPLSLPPLVVPQRSHSETPWQSLLTYPMCTCTV